MQAIGINKTAVTLAASVAAFKLGTRSGFDDPILGYQEFIYGKAAAAITGLGFACVESTGFVFSMITTALAAAGTSGNGTRVAAAQAAMAVGDFGWFQVYGKGSLRTLALAAKGTRLNTTATAGAVDDDAGIGSITIAGLTIGTATGGAAATNADAMFSYPTVSATL